MGLSRRLNLGGDFLANSRFASSEIPVPVVVMIRPLRVAADACTSVMTAAGREFWRCGYAELGCLLYRIDVSLRIGEADDLRFRELRLHQKTEKAVPGKV